MKTVKVLFIIISFYFSYLLADYLDGNNVYLPEKVTKIINDYQSPPKISKPKKNDKNHANVDVLITENTDNKELNKKDYLHIVKLILLFFILLALFFTLKKVISIYLRKRVMRDDTKAILNDLCRDQYYVFDDVKLNLKDKKIIIDHIVISQFGIFVIKTKKIKGKVYASSVRPTWTQANSKITNKFKNPIIENNEKILALKSILCFLSKDSINNMIVFIGNCKFETKRPCYVFFTNELLKEIIKKKVKVISQDDVLKTIGAIERERYITSKKNTVKNVEFMNLNPTN